MRSSIFQNQGFFNKEITGHWGQAHQNSAQAGDSHTVSLGDKQTAYTQPVSRTTIVCKNSFGCTQYTCTLYPYINPIIVCYLTDTNESLCTLCTGPITITTILKQKIKDIFIIHRPNCAEVRKPYIMNATGWIRRPIELTGGIR